MHHFLTNFRRPSLFLVAFTIFACLVGPSTQNVWDNLFSRASLRGPTIMFPKEFQIQFGRQFNLTGVGEATYNLSVKYSQLQRIFEVEDHLITTGAYTGDYILSQLNFDMNKRKLSLNNLISGCKTMTTNKYINLIFDNFDTMWRLGTLYTGPSRKGRHMFDLLPLLENLPGSEKVREHMKDVKIQAFFDKQTEKLHELRFKIGQGAVSLITDGFKEANFKADDFSNPEKWDCSKDAKATASIAAITQAFSNSQLGQLKTWFDELMKDFMENNGVEKLMSGELPALLGGEAMKAKVKKQGTKQEKKTNEKKQPQKKEKQSLRNKIKPPKVVKQEESSHGDDEM